ncbi:MAG TPA: ABC transporter permease [Syntrophomonadaceae bacterium]|nr:ABC transporter permease [Syntrophomonadaceae bacterium]
MSASVENSVERKTYLRKRRLHRVAVLLTQIMILLAFLLIWELAANARLIDPFITSQPSRMLTTILMLHHDGSLYMHIWVTIVETFWGFILGTGGGFLCAVLLWWSRSLNEISEPYLVVLNALPKVALGPLLIVWLGNGSAPIIGMALLISIIVTIISLVSGFHDVDPDKVKLLQSFGASRLQILTKVVLPSSLPTIISTLKVSVGLCLVGVIMGEFLVSKAGLGYLIVYGSQVFKLDLVMVSIVILAAMAAILYSVVAFFEKRLLHWQK